jgi:hypothetical protein
MVDDLYTHQDHHFLAQILTLIINFAQMIRKQVIVQIILE